MKKKRKRRGWGSPTEYGGEKKKPERCPGEQKKTGGDQSPQDRGRKKGTKGGKKETRVTSRGKTKGFLWEGSKEKSKSRFGEEGEPGGGGGGKRVLTWEKKKGGKLVGGASER